MNVASSNRAPAQEGATPRPTWLLPVVIGVGTAAGVSLFGSLLLVVFWFLTTDRVATDVASNGEASSIAMERPPPPAQSAPEGIAAESSDDELTAGADAADLPAALVNPDETDSAAADGELAADDLPANAEPIRFEDVPIIGGESTETKATRSASRPPGEESQEETPEKLDVPFLVLGCAPSTDGRQVVAWGYDWQTGDLPLDTARSADQRPADSRLAVIELASRKILADRKIAAVITQVDFNATGVYVTANEDPTKQEMSVLRLSAEELESLDRATIMLGTITSIADQLLVSERAENGGMRKYKLPSLEPADPDAEPISMRTKSQSALRLADGWLLDGVLWDDALKTPKLFLSPAEFYAVATNLSRAGGIFAVPILQGFVTHATSGKPPSSRDWRLERPRFSPHVPAVLAFKNDRGKTSLEFFEHNSGKILRSVVLTSGTPRNVRLVTTPDWIFVTLDNNTFLLPTRSEQSPIAIPFRIEPRQSTLVLSPAAPAQISYQAKDATKFELEIPAFTIDSRIFRQQSPTGEFTIDVAADVPLIVKAMNDVTVKERRAFDGDVAAWAESYVERIRPQFVRLTGREPVGVPLKVDAYVRAYSKDLSVAVLQHVYLVEVPMAEFEQYRRPSPTPLATQPAARPPSAAPQPQPKTPETSTPSGALRTWTDTQGRTLLAEFVQVEGENVVVVDQRQRTLRIPLDRLGEQDRAWVAEHAAARVQPPGDEK